MLFALTQTCVFKTIISRFKSSKKFLKLLPKSIESGIVSSKKKYIILGVVVVGVVALALVLGLTLFGKGGGDGLPTDGACKFVTGINGTGIGPCKGFLK